MIVTSRQINALADLIECAEGIVNNDVPTPKEMARFMLENGAYMLPCEIGDKVWVIRGYNGAKIAASGTVSEMHFISGMQLTIVVRGIGRGTWGEKVFATREECERAINGH